MRDRPLPATRALASLPASPQIARPASPALPSPAGAIGAGRPSGALAAASPSRLEDALERPDEKLAAEAPLLQRAAAPPPVAAPPPAVAAPPPAPTSAPAPAPGAGDFSTSHLAAEAKPKQEMAEGSVAGGLSSAVESDGLAGMPQPATAPPARAGAAAGMMEPPASSAERRARRQDEAPAAAEERAADGAAEVQAFAASYDTDAAADAGGWSLAAAGTFPPPPVAGHPSPPSPGTRWVRFRVRALAAAPAPMMRIEMVRIEIAWGSAAVERRLLGGAPATGARDVFELAPAVLRRGWTAVYEVRFAPAAVRAAAGPLARLSVRDGGANGRLERERELNLSDFSASWREAPAALRLPCLAAAFAERQAAGGGEDLSDLLAAVRSLAATAGDRRADELVVRMLQAARPRPAGPP
jgi:hypothetical protein